MHPPVNWHEGMFLRPHHFQSADRHWAGQVARSSRLDLHHNWGVRVLKLDEEALKASRFVVRELEARFPDGTAVRVPDDDLVNELDLRADLSGPGVVEVMLAVPSLNVGRANTGDADDELRYRRDTPRDGVPDENSGQNPRPVQFRRLNVRLLKRKAGTDAPAGYTVLPVARVERSAQAEAVPQLSPEYIPPLLGCDGWPLAQAGVILPIYNRVAKLVDQRAKQVRSRRITFDSNSPGDRQIFEGLRVLNEGMATLGVMAFAAGVHPFQAYLELCRFCGRLAVFGETPAVPDLPRYDHDDLGRCFFTVKRYIDDFLSRGVFELGYEEVPFVGVGLRLRLKEPMKPVWLSPSWSTFVGVDSTVPRERCVRMLTGELNMKIGAFDRVEDIYQRGLLGLAFNYDAQPPRELPSSESLTYFRVNRDASRDEWKFIENTCQVAIRLNEKLIEGSIQDQEEVVIRTMAGQPIRMRFTLYVVPPKPQAA